MELTEEVTNAYQTGMKLTKEAMQAVEIHLQRWFSLEKWFVEIPSSGPVKPQAHSTPPKRPRGCPRTKPLPDPTMPKRPRGRPRKLLLADVPPPLADGRV